MSLAQPWMACSGSMAVVWQGLAALPKPGCGLVSASVFPSMFPDIRFAGAETPSEENVGFVWSIAAAVQRGEARQVPAAARPEGSQPIRLDVFL